MSFHKQILMHPAALRFIYAFTLCYGRTWRFGVENEDNWRAHIKNGGRILMCTWHQQFFSAFPYFESCRNYRPAMMISQSRDGDIGAGLARRIGWTPVRGSSSRGGGRALVKMVRELKKHGLGGHILDGPRGPIGEVKTGVSVIAARADAWIAPLAVSVDRAWHCRSWDRFLAPKPFARITIRFFPLIEPVETNDPERVRTQCRQIETILQPELK